MKFSVNLREDHPVIHGPMTVQRSQQHQQRLRWNLGTTALHAFLAKNTPKFEWWDGSSLDVDIRAL